MQCARAHKKNNTNTSQSCFLKYGNMEQHPPIMCKANSNSNGHVWSNTWQMQNSQMQGSKCKGQCQSKDSFQSVFAGRHWKFHWKQRFLGATQNQKLLNLWVRTQANNLEQGAMPNISLTLKLPLFFCLGGNTKLKHCPVPSHPRPYLRVCASEISLAHCKCETIL